MASNRHEFTTAIFEDGTCAVLRSDSSKPRLLEVIATFYDAAQARHYAQSQNPSSDGHREEQQPAARQVVMSKPKQAQAVKAGRPSGAEPKQTAAVTSKRTSEVKLEPATVTKSKLAGEAAPANNASDLSERQTAVLRALHSMMDKKRRVEVRGAELAKASSIPLGSLHSVLASLEKKHLVKTERAGSAQFRAIYEVLEAPRKSARPVNGAAHGKGPQAVTSTH